MMRFMWKALLIVGICLASGPVGAAEKPAATPDADYLIGPGDALFISVWKNEELTAPVTVLPDGRITFPLIGEMVAGGKSVGEFKKELEKKISRYVSDPVLSVLVQQVNSLMIYVIGKVNKPGRFLLNTPINVMQALSMAGGLNPFADRNKIRIFREEGNETKIFFFKYDDVSQGENMAQNILLRRGDLIVVR